MSMLTDHETACLILALRDDKQRLMRDLAAAREALTLLKKVEQASVSILAAWDIDDNDDYCRFVHRLEPHQRVLRAALAAASVTARLSPASSGSP